MRLILTLFLMILPVQAALADRLPDHVIARFGTPPPVPDGPLPADVARDIAATFVVGAPEADWGPRQQAALERIVAAKDPRVGWLISDMMRFTWRTGPSRDLAEAAETLLGIELGFAHPWGAVTDHLMAWDIPAYPGYLADKRRIFVDAIPGWERLFVEGQIDWRHVSWGGVPIDARGHDETHHRCNCIPAADNPAVSSAQQATWLADDAIVFGIVLNGEARAYPRQIMEVREMVNDTLGGRDLGIPYCTLCGAAQAWFTDEMPAGVERPILRTTGLLIRSNKVMYDLNTHSLFDTFRGNAVTGPLAEIGLQLTQAPVITTTWADWRAAYPETTVLVEALALGRNFDFRNGRDADGPIFPIGDVDPRLPVQEDVLGTLNAQGQPVAFQRSAALLALRSGQPVALNGVELRLDAGGLRAVGADGEALGSHEAFWFAWSQFHPATALWSG